LSAQHTHIAMVVATYWFVSISMVYLNKMLMSNEGISIDAPLFVTWFQCVVTTGICYLAGLVGDRARKSHSYKQVESSDGGGDSQKSFFLQFPRADFDIETAKRVFPLSVVFVGMITFNNLCLKFVEVSFYTVARSLTIVFNVAFSFLMLGVPTSARVGGCLGIVVLGFLIGSGGEINFSITGTVAGVCSSVFVSLNSIFTKKVLPVVDDDHWRLTFYNNVNASVLFLPLILFLESGVIIEAMSHQLSTTIFWSAMMVAGFFGFSIGIVSVLQIKATSPLSHNISGTAKAAVQSMMAFSIWGNAATYMGVLGIFIVLGGSFLYTLVKMGEGGRKSTPAPSNPPPNGNNDDLEALKSSQVGK